MADPIRAKFYQASFELVHDGEVLSLRGLVSEQGVTKIFLTHGLPEYWRGLAGREVAVRLDSLGLKGVLLQQFVEHGTYYEIRFRGLLEPHRQYLRQRIQSEGISPGWQRQYPRIPVAGGADPELPVPNLCMVRFVGQEVFVNVVNFTLGGVRIETIGDNLSELRVGATLSFDLITTTGEIFANLNGEVRNFAIHENVGAEGVKTVTRSFGLRFKNLDPVNERKYRALIREYCLKLQKRFEDFDDTE
jgi:hypothetical protein